jgi:hypothetical protein
MPKTGNSVPCSDPSMTALTYLSLFLVFVLHNALAVAFLTRLLVFGLEAFLMRIPVWAVSRWLTATRCDKQRGPRAYSQNRRAVVSH